MQQRINIAKLKSSAYKAMYALENYLKQTSLSEIQKELIKIRASQMDK